MKYYEVVSNSFCFYLKGKIYPENYKQSEYCNNIGLHAKHCPSVFKEIPAGEYFVQEGIMPEYFAIKRIADNPLWKKYIEWLVRTYKIIGRFDGSAKFYGYIGSTNPNTIFENSIECIINNPVELTLEQWDKIVNKTMEEEFKLQKVWFIQLTEEDKDIVINWHKSVDKQNERRYNVGSFYRVYSDGSGDAWNYNSLPKNTQVITTEQFIKYVLNKEVMKENKEIIGWKLKENCKQYRKAIERLVDPMCLDSEIENLGVKRNNLSIANLKQAGVLELWFEPAYKEEILQFGGHNVTFEKVTSGVRITCNGETGTFSQIEAIYNIVLKKEKMMFGSQEVKQISYSDDTYWSSESLKAKPASIKIGCTEGTWEEFTAIYEKAKSML